MDKENEIRNCHSLDDGSQHLEITKIVEDIKLASNENQIKFNESLLNNNNDLSSLPSHISGKLINCNNVQFGTYISATNLNIIDSTKSDIPGVSIKLDPNRNDASSGCDSVKKKDETSCVSENKNGLRKLIKKILYTTILLMVIFITFLLVVVIVMNNIHNNDNKNITNLNIPVTAINNSWFIPYKNWADTEQSKTCYKKLPPIKVIKFWYSTGTCNSFEKCKNILDQDKFLDKACHYDDIKYHFAVSENGLVYEGLSTACEIPPEFKECNQSVLYINIFVKYIYDLSDKTMCLTHPNFAKQIKVIIELIKYNQFNGVVLSDHLYLYVFKRYCGEEFGKEIRKGLPVDFVFSGDYSPCPVNTCIEDY